MTEVAGVFGKPFNQQVAAFRIRLAQLQATTGWKDVWQSEHDRAFMVAGAQKAELLADLAAAIDKAIVKGTTLEEFRSDFKAAVDTHNWHGWAGEETEKGRAWRTRVIYKTNLSTSYAAGRYAQLKAAGFTYWVYRHGNALEPRLQHLGWDGLILPADHPFWATHYPPNGWGCTCYAIGARTMPGAMRRGGNPAIKLADGWDTPDPRSGTPPGIDKGWAYAPGASVADTVSSLSAKPVNWDYSLATAFMRDIPAGPRDAFSEAFRRQPALTQTLSEFARDVRDGAKTPELKSLGLATSGQISEIEAHVSLPTPHALWDYVVDRSSVGHVWSRHSAARIELSRGQRAVVPSDFGRLPRLISAPDTIEPGEVEVGKMARFVLRKAFGTERLVGIFEVLPGRRRFSLLSLWVERIKG